MPAIVVERDDSDRGYLGYCEVSISKRSILFATELCYRFLEFPFCEARLQQLGRFDQRITMDFVQGLFWQKIVQ